MTQTIADHLNSLQEQMERIEKAKKQIEEMSRMDTLTGLFNRRYLFESLQYQLDLSNRYQSEIGLMILDVDFFKKINDGYGHKMGDEVLRVLGATLKKLCRNVDILGRYGGEELVVFCPKTNLENTRVLAERIRVEVSKLLFKVDSEKTFSISVSIGVSENLFAKKIKNQELNPSDLIDTADGCLYIAKENGRNQVVVFGEQSHE